MPFVISKSSRDILYTVYVKRGSGNFVTNEVQSQILVKGGQHVMSKDSLITPQEGVITEVSDAEAAALRDDVCFKRHMAAGFVQIIDTNEKLTVSNASKDMQDEDDGAQLTAEDFSAESAQANVTVGETAPTAKTPTRSRKRK